MVAYYFNSNSSSGSACLSSLDPFARSLEGVNEDFPGAWSMVPQALVLDSEKGELVKAPARVGNKAGSETKALAALKSHSEAERRRRERINAHLTTLRCLVPCTEKMDKATLLAAVVSQVKQLKTNAAEACEGHLIPMDSDEINVETYFDGTTTLYFKASICCDYRPELLSDIRQTIAALPLKMENAEISTSGSRVKTEFVFSNNRNKDKNAIDDYDEEMQLLLNSIHQALTSVLVKGSGPGSQQYSPRTTLPNKRRRVTDFFDS